MREVELKAIVDDLAGRRKKIEAAGGTLSFEGKISDRRYDFTSGELSGRDEVLRTRTYQSRSSTRTYMDWKGPTEMQGGYKIREEITAPVEDLDSLEKILEKLGLALTSEMEGGANVISEAAVAGVPTLGTDVGHIAEYAPEGAIAVPKRDAGALAA